MKKVILLSAVVFTSAFCPLTSYLALGQNIAINTTGAANTTLSMLEILQLSTGAGTRGLYILHNGTIAGTGYGLWSEKTGGAGTTNIAGYFTASGLGTNYGLWVNAGGTRIVPLASGVNGAVVTSNSSGDLSINNFSGSATNILLGNNTWGTIVSAGGVTGSGTVDYLARWTTATNLGTGVTRDNNSTVGINVAPSASNRLYVNGASAMSAILGQYNATQYGYLGLSTAGAYGQYSATLYGYLGTANSGVFGTSNNAAGAGVWGNGSTVTTGVYGDVNLATDFGMWGQNTNASGTGIVGAGNNIAVSYLGGGSGGAFSSTNVGVYGYGNNTALSYGVYGVSANSTGDGLVGINSVAAGGGSGTGMWGASAQNGGGVSMAAIEAYNSNATGTGMAAGGNNLGIVTLVNGGGGAYNGQTIGVWGRTTQAGVTQNAGVYGTCSSFGRSSYLSLYNGTYYKTIATGAATNSCAVPDLNENMVCMHAPETPEAYFQDFGQGQLINGRVHIELDPIFAKNVTINEKHPLRVFIQLEGDCKGVYITNKTTTGFDVVELGGGNSNTPFQWFITCNMADSKGENGLISKFADLRFEPAPIPMEENKPTLLETKMRKNIESKTMNVINADKTDKALETPKQKTPESK